MQINVTSTTRVVDVEGIPGRVWEGTTDTGVRLFAVVTRIAVRDDQDLSQFERELERQHAQPSAECFAAIPARLVL